jgi:hypothetical protein
VATLSHYKLVINEVVIFYIPRLFNCLVLNSRSQPCSGQWCLSYWHSSQGSAIGCTPFPWQQRVRNWWRGCVFLHFQTFSASLSAGWIRKIILLINSVLGWLEMHLLWNRYVKIPHIFCPIMKCGVLSVTHETNLDLAYISSSLDLLLILLLFHLIFEKKNTILAQL